MRIVRRIYFIIGFLLFYLLKLLQSNLYIAYDILTPRMHTNPGFIKVPLSINSEFGMLLFSNLLSMTPGTLVTDIAEDRKFIIVHVLYRKSADTIISDIQGIQKKIRRISE